MEHWKIQTATKNTALEASTVNNFTQVGWGLLITGALGPTAGVWPISCGGLIPRGVWET